MRVRTGIRAGFPKDHGRGTGTMAGGGETGSLPPIATMPAGANGWPPVGPRQEIIIVYPQAEPQGLLSGLRGLLTAAVKRLRTWWRALRPSALGRDPPQAQVMAPKRFWEIDVWRGLALGLMLVHHLILSWLRVLSTSLARLALRIFLPLSALVLAMPPLAVGAMILAPLLGYPRPIYRSTNAALRLARIWLPTALFGILAVVVAWLMPAAAAIGGVCVFLMGLSMTLSYQRALRGSRGRSLFPKYLSRGLGLFGWGLALTGLSLLILPQMPILFGILHLLGLSTILAYPFLKLPAWSSLAVGLPVIGLGMWLAKTQAAMHGLWSMLLGIGPVGMALLDFWPLLPWFGVVLLGIAAGKILYPEGQRAFTLPDLSETGLVRGLSYLGSNSLPIYLLQWLVVFPGLALAEV